MGIQTNDAIVKFGTTKTLEANGASAANNTIVQADDASYNIATDGDYCPDAEFVLAATFGTAPTENTTLDLYARELNIASTNDAQAPETTFRNRYIGSFQLNNVTATQYIKLIAYEVPVEADYYLHNNGTGQTLSAGWSLTVTPRTKGPKA